MYAVVRRRLPTVSEADTAPLGIIIEEAKKTAVEAFASGRYEVDLAKLLGITRGDGLNPDEKSALGKAISKMAMKEQREPTLPDMQVILDCSAPQLKERRLPKDVFVFAFEELLLNALKALAAARAEDPALPRRLELAYQDGYLVLRNTIPPSRVPQQPGDPNAEPRSETGWGLYAVATVLSLAGMRLLTPKHESCPPQRVQQIVIEAGGTS